MKNNFPKKKALALGAMTCLLVSNVQAQISPIQFILNSSADQIVPPNGFAWIHYTLTKKPSLNVTSFSLNLPAGVKQLRLGYPNECIAESLISSSSLQSCNLTLRANLQTLLSNQGFDSRKPATVFIAPEVCFGQTSIQCFRPNAHNTAKFSSTNSPLSSSVNSLALSVYPTSPALTGQPRTITITNTGSASATNVVYSTIPTSLPGGMTITPSEGCTGIQSAPGTTLAANGGSCTLTITPGSVATTETPPSDPSAIIPPYSFTPPVPYAQTPVPPYNPPYTPLAGAVAPVILNIAGRGTNPLIIDLNVLAYGSVYQSGYVFSIDDTTASNLSVGGTVVSLEDQAYGSPYGIGAVWSSNGKPYYTGTLPNSSSCIPNQSHLAQVNFNCTAYDNISGIYDNSVPPISCLGNQDGSCNTGVIVASYPTKYWTNPKSAPYAAGLCQAYQTADTTVASVTTTYTDWYLPSICEMGYEGVSPNPPIPAPGTGCGGGTSAAGQTPSPPALIQNIQSNLVDTGILTLNGLYWSSTEWSGGASNDAWYQTYRPGYNQSYQQIDNKQDPTGVRCVRAITTQ